LVVGLRDVGGEEVGTEHKDISFEEFYFEGSRKMRTSQSIFSF
jgi:hypothetical protein